jgi:hypothetical protein
VPEWLGSMTVAQLAIIVGSVATIAGVLWRLWRAIRPVFKGVVDFLEDWNGEPERRGVPARPGVMERLAAVEDGQQRTNVRLDRIEQQTAG